MLKGGAVDDIEILIGMHGRPIQECRVGEAAPALYYSAATHVKIDITGVQSHGARPYLGTSALDAACLVVQSANALRFNSNVVYNLKATQIHADAGVANAVPGTATITFDLRSRDNDVMELMIQNCGVRREMQPLPLAPKRTSPSCTRHRRPLSHLKSRKSSGK